MQIREGKQQGFCTHMLWDNGFGGHGVACWLSAPKFAGSNPAEAVGYLGWKILSTPSFGGEVKPSVSCRRFAACKRSLNLRGSRNLGNITGQFLAHSSTFRYQDLSCRCGRSGTRWRKWERLKAGENNGKLPPKNLPRMQCARAIPVTWLGSGSCQPGL